MKSFFLKAVHHLIVIQGNGLAILACPVYDRRNMAVATLAPAGTRTGHIARLGIEYMVAAHYKFSLTLRSFEPLIP
jgi:hypothetical protein